MHVCLSRQYVCGWVCVRAYMYRHVSRYLSIYVYICTYVSCHLCHTPSVAGCCHYGIGRTS